MTPMGQHSAPALRLAETPDRITVLAGAMRNLLVNPGSAEARKEIDRAMGGCTDEEYEAAWAMVQQEQMPSAPDDPADAPVTADAPQAPYRLRDAPVFLARILSAVTGDTIITWAMTATVAIVAVDAAIVSYSHIYALATGAPGSGVETGIQPRLLPMSIDGVIAEASLVLLYAARHKLKAPRLARFMLSLGITATVAANVAHGLPSSLLSHDVHVVISALLSAWPAGAFIGSVEMAMQLVRAARVVADTEQDSSADTDADSSLDNLADSTLDRQPDKAPDKARDAMRDITPDSGTASRGTRTAPQTTSQPDKVATAIKRHPRWDDDKIAAECGVHPRTVKRRRAALAKPPQKTSAVA
jgi:hypothetical protein